MNSPGVRHASLPCQFQVPAYVLWGILSCGIHAETCQEQPAAQAPAAAIPAPETAITTQPATEVLTKDAPATFSSRVNLVPITVVVRDDKGHAVGSLTKDDFRVLDNGKLQVISRFSVEKPATPVILEKEAPEPGEPPPPAPGPTPVIATRFVAYLFDDVHLKWEDLVRVRDAAAQFITTSLQPSDRAAIYTTSGQTMVDFTADLNELQQALARLQSRPVASGPGDSSECPYLTYYMSDLLIEKQDQAAIGTARAETIACNNFDMSDPKSAPPIQVIDSIWQSVARQAITRGEHETRLALDLLNKVVRRLSGMPGQRGLVVTSPGFITPLYYQEVGEVINRAIRANVIISTIDARGLWTPPGYNASDATPRGGGEVVARKATYDNDAAFAQEEVLSSLAAGTGGTFFHNNNDLVGGLRELSAAPEFVYVLGFTPSNLKFDGKFHSLKVVLANSKGLSMQARKGYYAPKKMTDEAAQAHQEIEDALFNREVLKDFPVELHTQFFKPSDDAAKLSVLARIDFRRLHYNREQDRNRNSVTVVSGLFDTNGNFITSWVKVLDLRLKDETLANFEKRFGAGITVKSTFDIKPGSYVVRLVVRDSVGQMMAAENGAIQIP